MISPKYWRIKWLCEQNELPEYVCRYYRRLEESPSKKDKIEDIRFVVLDTETTGLEIRKDALLSIGAVAVTEGNIKIMDSIELTIKSAKDIKKETIPIHGILPVDIEEGTEEQYALGRFLAYLNADVFVAHHTYFDLKMIEKSIKQYAPPFELHNFTLDTAHIAQRLDFGLSRPNHIDRRKYTLDALCKRFDIEPHDRHTAWGDAFITAQLFLKLTHLLKERGVNTLGDLMRSPASI